MNGLYLLAAHFLGDWFLQTDAMAAEKLNSSRARTVHVTIYTASVTVVYAFVTSSGLASIVVFASIVGVPHYVIDSRRWKEPVDGFPTRPLWFDQAGHIVTLAVAVALAGLF